MRCSSSSSVRLARPVSGSLSTESSLSRQARGSRCSLPARTRRGSRPTATGSAPPRARRRRADRGCRSTPWWSVTTSSASQVGDPVLVERDHADHHEEDEVRLGDAAPEVHETDRAGHQARRSRRRIACGGRGQGRGQQQRPGHGDEDDDGGELAVAPGPGEEDERERREDAEPDDGPVPALPRPPRAATVPRQQAHGLVPEPRDHGPGIGRSGSAPESDPASPAPRGRAGGAQRRSRPARGDSSQILAGRIGAGMPSSVGWPRTGPVCEWSRWLRGATSSASRAASAVSP